MKSSETDLKKYTEKIQLKASERRELRERVLSYMEYHPLPKQSSAQKKVSQGILSEAFVTFNFNFSGNPLYARIASGVAVVLLILAPFAAERSVPGDALYLIKTGINEPIQGQLVNTPYKKIEFETKLMERRIAEARVLASKGKLTEEVKAQITEDVKDHTEAVQNGLAELRTQDADGAALAQIAFSSSLEVQSAVLGVNESTNSTSSVDTILSVVNEAHDQVVLNQVSESASFESLNAQVEIETTRALELFENVKVSATEDEVKDIDRRFSDINRLIVEAQEKHATEPETAVTDLGNTLGLLQKLILFMTDINVRETVTLDAIVPVVLSDEERIGLARVALDNSTILERKISERVASITDSGVEEKVSEGLAYVTELVTRATEAIEGADVVTAEEAIVELEALMIDLDALTIPYVDPEIITDPSVVETPGTTTTDSGTTTENGSEGNVGTTTSTTTGSTTTEESQI